MLADIFKNLPIRLPKRMPANWANFIREKFKDKRIRYGLIGLIILIFLFGIMTKKDSTTMFSQTIRKFISATIEYQPKEAEKYVMNMSKDMVMVQMDKIAKAKASGMKTTLDEAPQIKFRTTGATEMVADVVVKTTEIWPGKSPEHWTHRFLIRGQKASDGWKITEMMEMPAQ